MSQRQDRISSLKPLLIKCYIYFYISVCLQINNLTLPSLATHELNVEQEEQGLNPNHNLLEDCAEKYKCRFCSLKMSVLADIQTHMREVCMHVCTFGFCWRDT